MISPPKLGPRTVYNPVGRCIYCPKGTVATELGDEHIIAEGLGGTWILPDASCKKHEGITSSFEGYVLRYLLIEARTYLQLPTKRPTERPERFPVTLFDKNGEASIIEASQDDRPVHLALLQYITPGILLGLKPRADDSPTGTGPSEIWLSLWWPKPGISNATYYGSSGHSIDAYVEWTRFSRMLAKIGHSYAVAQLGIGNFQPLLLDIINDRTPKFVGYLIGGSPVREPRGSALHELSLERHALSDETLYVVRVRLFAYLGGPIYYVVAGTTRRFCRGLDISFLKQKP